MPVVFIPCVSLSVFLCLSLFIIFCADHDQERMMIIWSWWMAIIFCIITKSPKIKAFLASGIEVMEVDSIKTVNDLRIQWFPVSHCFISFASSRWWSSSPHPCACAVLCRFHTNALLTCLHLTQTCHHHLYLSACLCSMIVIKWTRPRVNCAGVCNPQATTV